MYVYVHNGGQNHSLPGLTSKAYHIPMWIFLSSGILGNILVLFWRLSKRELRYSILSLLIVSLAAADLLWCLHCLIQEAMLLRPLFFNKPNDNYSLDGSNENLCLTITFLTFVSCDAAMLTSVAIAMYSFCVLVWNRYGRLIVIYTVLIWVGCASVATAALVERWKKWYDPVLAKYRGPMPLNLFSLTVIYGCISVDELLIFPAVVTTVNSLSSLAIVAIYLSLCIRLRHRRIYRDSEVVTLKIRLGIIAMLNVVAWLPPCIYFWYALVTKRTVLNGKFSIKCTEFQLLMTAAVSSVNPIVYSLQISRIGNAVHRFFRLTCKVENGDKNEPKLLDSKEHPMTSLCNIKCYCCVCGCCPSRSYPYRMSSLTVATEEESLFPD
jgi:hypothetical protein